MRGGTVRKSAPKCRNSRRRHECRRGTHECVRHRDTARTYNRMQMTPKRLGGVWAPAITPFRQDLSPDPERFARHARWLLENGCSGLAAFGTNSEANSLSVEERMTLLR